MLIYEWLDGKQCYAYIAVQRGSNKSENVIFYTIYNLNGKKIANSFIKTN